MSLLQIELSIVSNVIPVVLIAVGSAYSIHVFSKFTEVDTEQRPFPARVHGLATAMQRWEPRFSWLP